jgi:GH15 family glucan-1,4-alpha-glucosidase
VTPSGRFTSQRRYREGTNILETTFHCEAGGTVRVTDFMAIHRRTVSRLGRDVGTSRQIMRLVEAMETPCTMEVRFKPAFDFGRHPGSLELAPGKGAVAHGPREHLALYGPKLSHARIEDGELTGRLELRPGEHAWLALCHPTSKRGIERALATELSSHELERTEDYWRRWIACCRYQGPYAEAVMRSALILKLLTYEPTGAVIAAPTTSLPELIGGVRNWDYRYTWLRDASLMLYGLSTLGYHEEATDFVEWLAAVNRAEPELRPQIMYTIHGSRHLREIELDHLEGYKGSAPVRVGNAASGQHQHDIFGNVLNVAYQFRHTVEDETITPVPEPHHRMSRRNWQFLRSLVEDAASSWQQRDNGIWEVRGGQKHFLYSKLMCWTALDRGVRLAESEGLAAPLERWRKVREDIRDTILKRGYNEKLGAFTQALDGHELDAAVLAMPRVGFLPATDRRVMSTIDRIRQDLTRNGLVERYRADDGLPGGEGTFALCSFWMVDALALCGRQEEARELLERLLSFRNDVGLLSEEIDPTSTTDTLLGNFPQGFSHMALIGSVVTLAATERFGAEQQVTTEPERARAAIAASTAKPTPGARPGE